MNKLIISPSLLAADFSILKQEVLDIEKAGANWLHLDVMDGNFVPNISFGAEIIKAIKKHSNLFFDVHLMVEKPEWYIKEIANAGADLITIHYEATNHLDRAINLIKSYGKRAGVAINPATPINVLETIIHEIDFVLIMTVNPGFGGQKFIENSVLKIKELRSKYPHIDIEVDGGINDKTAKLVKDAGANILVAGSYVFNGNYEEKINSLK